MDIARPLVIALDVNETLSDMSPLAERLERIGAPSHLLASWFASTLRDGFGLAAAGAYADFEAIGRATLTSLLTPIEGLKMDPGAAAETVLAAFGELPLHNDVRPGLERLHDQALRLVTLTNGGVDNVTSLLERGGVAGLIERSMSVAEVGRWKPAPEPYLYAAERCGVAPEEVMLVAVHPWDIDGAKRAGLAACWIDRQRTPYPEPLTPPDISCDGFAELARVLADAGPH